MRFKNLENELETYKAIGQPKIELHTYFQNGVIPRNIYKFYFLRVEQNLLPYKSSNGKNTAKEIKKAKYIFKIQN